MKEIQLTQGRVAKVDDEDFERLNIFKWCYTSGYAGRRIHKGDDRRHHYMHQVLCPCDRDKQVIHLDGDRLNNQKSNLEARSRRHITQATATRSMSGYKGVHFRNGKWVAQICIDKKNKHLGAFVDKLEAARAYDTAAVQVYGANAYLNFRGT